TPRAWTALRWPRRKFSVLLLDAGDERPEPQPVHLLDRHGTKVGLGDERGQIQIRLETDMNGERRDGPFDGRQRLVRAAEMVEDDDPPAGAADALHLAHDGQRVWNDADH